MKRTRLVSLLLVLAASMYASTKMLVTVVEPKSGKPVTGLKAEDFIVLDDKTPRQVESADYASFAEPGTGTTVHGEQFGRV